MTAPGRLDLLGRRRGMTGVCAFLPYRSPTRKDGLGRKARLQGSRRQGPECLRDMLHRTHAIVGRLPHAAVTLKAASRRTGHNSNSWPSVGRSTPPPLSFTTKTFRLMKIGSLSPLQSRV